MGTDPGRAAPALRRNTLPVVPVVAVVGALLAVAVFEATRSLPTREVARDVGVFVVVVGSLWFACTKRTSLALALFMLYLGLLDGYVKLASGSSSITLARDALLYAIVAGLVVRAQVEGRRWRLPPLSGWVLAYIAFVLVQIPNPSGGTLTHSLEGVRPHLEFVPLFFLGYMIVRDVTTLRRFVFLLIVIGAANGVVSLVQFNLTPQQLSNWGPGYATRILGLGGFSSSGRTFSAAGVMHVRPFGLGSDEGDGGVFGVVALGGVFAIAMLSTIRWPYRVAAVILGVACVVAIITSQGKAVIVAALATVLAYGILTATTQRRVSGLLGLALTVALIYYVVGAILPNPGGSAYRYQGLAASKILTTVSQERQGQLGLIGFSLKHYPLGAGLGTGGPAAGAPGASGLALNTESEFTFLDIEAGIPGLVAVVGFTVLLLVAGLRRCRREPDPEARALLAAVISPIAGLLVDYYAGSVSVTVPAGPFLWSVGGVAAYWLYTRPGEGDHGSVRGGRGPALVDPEPRPHCFGPGVDAPL